jgi:1-acyl-sn-glycerol-3-phosphate acyltransferase
MRAISNLEVMGAEHLDAGGPFILVPNHTSHLDTPLVLTALPGKIRRRTVVAAAMDNFYMKAMKARFTTLVFNGIPVDRHKLNRRSSQLALELVQDGWNLLIFAEGGRTPDGDLQEFKGGAAYLAERANAAVVPVYIHEAGFLRGPRYAKAPKFINAAYQRRHNIKVAFGSPMTCEADENIRRFGVRIEEAVAELGRGISGNDEYGVRDAE